MVWTGDGATAFQFAGNELCPPMATDVVEDVHLVALVADNEQGPSSD